MSQFLYASLYVGDLSPDVTEEILAQKFSQAGPLLSVRVCRDRVTKRSLGYAYVNFKETADAERAIDTMNYDLVKGRPCRIMWSKRDPCLRRSGVGNIIIKDLDSSIDSKALYDTFSNFGKILSCKVKTSCDNGSSKSFGFVHFDTQESADLAIEKVNGMLINNQKVYVGKFNARIERYQDQGPEQLYTNVYVDNFGEDFDSDQLLATFEKFGKILRAVVMTDQTGKSRGFGFVNFETHDAAAKAVEELDGSVINGRSIHCARAQKKKERQSKYEGINLYIKNLDDSIDSEKLKEEFEKYGNITSAKVMKHENGWSKGFGFVCFSSPEDATMAVTEMNGRIIASKPLYVGLAQCKEERVDHLTALRMQPMADEIQSLTQKSPPCMQPGVQGQCADFPTASSGACVLVPQPIQPQPIQPQPMQPQPMQPLQPMQPSQPMQPPQPMQQLQPMQAAHPMQVPQPMQLHPMSQLMPQHWQSGPAHPPYILESPQCFRLLVRRRMGRVQHQQRWMNPQRIRAQQQNVQQQQPGTGPVMTQSQRRNTPCMSNPQPVQPLLTSQDEENARPCGATGLPQDIGSQQTEQATPNGLTGLLPDISLACLSEAAPQEQKQMIGEHLYSRIKNMHPEMAGKITGMFLEMENSELLHMLDTPESLKRKVEEAVTVLKEHQGKGDPSDNDEY